MRRIKITGGSGRWFDSDSAEQIDEGTYWDGKNRISQATGSRGRHQTLYRTAGGRYVLLRTSAWQGERDEVTEITASQAAVWLSKNDYGSEDAVAIHVGAEYAALEIT